MSEGFLSPAHLLRRPVEMIAILGLAGLCSCTHAGGAQDPIDFSGNLSSDLVSQDPYVIEGIAIDAATGRPVSGANVKVVGARVYNPEDVLGTLTGPDGRFRLVPEAAPFWRVAVHATGMRSWELNVRPDSLKRDTLRVLLRYRTLDRESGDTVDTAHP